MNIDIQSSPPSAANIGELREEASTELDHLVDKTRVYFTLMTAIGASAVILLIGSNIYWPWAQWGHAALLMTYLIGCFVMGGALGSAIGSRLNTFGAMMGFGLILTGSPAVFPGTTQVILFVQDGALAIGVATTLALVSGALLAQVNKMMRSKLRSCLRAIESLKTAERMACLDIQSWLEDDDIRRYRDLVVAQGRELTNGEVSAMRRFWSDHERQQAMAKPEATIDRAYRAV